MTREELQDILLELSRQAKTADGSAMSLLIALYRWVFHSKYSQSELAEMLLISRASLYRSENFTFRYELSDAPAPVEIPQEPPPQREPTLEEVLAATRREVMGDVESPANIYERFPSAKPAVDPAQLQQVDALEILDREDFDEFCRIYKKKGDFRLPSFNRVRSEWNSCVSAGITGKHILMAVRTANASDGWKEQFGKYIPGALKFLEERQMMNFLPDSFDPYEDMRKRQPVEVVYADVDLSILANASYKDGNTDELDALTPMPVPNLDELRFSNVVAALYEWSTHIALRNDRDADYDPVRLRSLTEYLSRQFADGALQSMFPQPIPLGYGVRATISELNALLASVRSSRIGYPNSMGDIER